MYVAIAPAVTVSTAIVTSLAGVNPPTAVPKTVIVSDPANEAPVPVNVAVYVVPVLLMLITAPVPEPVVLQVTDV